MIGLTMQHDYYLCDVAVDFRKGFDGLCGIVTDYMGRNPLDGSAYIFMNSQRNRIKILVWDVDGFVMYYKRLERGTFDHPIVSKEGEDYRIQSEHLLMIIKGIVWEKIVRKSRHVMV